ncbi:MAG TPA: glycosyltransferase, partial [Acidimicrobiales bacterium]|nr:glycosyltransferase [Acidimicrobiales bacterium]
VVCNGCTDGTVALARAARGVQVVELDRAGKALALNAGDAAAGDAYPRLYVDADLRLTVDDLAVVLAALATPGPVLAAPRATFDLDDAPWLVRSYYGALGELPFFVRHFDAHFEGHGMYGLTEAARRRFGAFPDLVADDAFVDRMFDPDEKVLVGAATVGVPVPHDAATFLRAHVRTAAGSRELGEWLRAAHPDRLVTSDTHADPTAPLYVRLWHHARNGGLVASRHPRSLGRLCVYLAVEAYVRVTVSLRRRRGRRTAATWR